MFLLYYLKDSGFNGPKRDKDLKISYSHYYPAELVPLIEEEKK